MTTHIINWKEWGERAFNHIGYSSVSHIFAMFPNEEALVLVREKDDMKEEKPDYNSSEWEVEKVTNAPGKAYQLQAPGYEHVILRRKLPTNQNPMPEIKPGDHCLIPPSGWFAIHRKDGEACIFTYTRSDSAMGGPVIQSSPISSITKIYRPGEGIIWERGSK